MTYQMNIAATFDITILEKPIQYWQRRFGDTFKSRLTITDYNSVHSQLLQPDSDFGQNDFGMNFLLFNEEHFSDEAHRDIFCEAVSTYLARGSPKLVVVQVPSRAHVRSLVFNRLELMSDKFQSTFALHRLSQPDGDDIFDEETRELASMPFTEQFYLTIGTFIFRKFWVNCNSANFKVFVMDCDHTLWGGILNELGAAGINYSDAREVLRNQLKMQTQCGRLLCINSANDEQDVRRVFRENADVLGISEEDVTAWKVNWIPKHQNLRALAQDLNLGLDSFVFIDDDHTNIGICRQEVPEVLSLQYDCDYGKEFIDNLWLLDTPDFSTKEDRSRGEMYKANLERKVLENECSGTYLSFLQKLGIKTTIRELQAADVNRVSQLSQRSNRFNATTIRLSEEQVRKWSGKDRKCFVVEVSDNFGIYGLCGCMFVLHEVDVLCVENFVLSCRVLNKGVDIEMIRFLGCLYENDQTVLLKFKKSAKNNLIEQAFTKVAAVAGEDRIAEGFLFKANAIESLSIEDVFSQQGIVEKAVSKQSKNSANFLKRNEILVDLFQSDNKNELVNETKKRRKELEGKMADIVTIICEDILGRTLVESQRDVPFMNLGMSSVQMVQFVATLRRQFPKQRERVDVSLPFNYPSINQVIAYFESTNQRTAVSPSVCLNEKDVDAIGITSMSCRFPGGIQTPIDFWNFLEAGKNSRKKISRWSSNYYPGDCGSEVTFMHALEDVSLFDNRKFNISDSEAKLMDPQQKLVLEVAYEALYRSSINLQERERDDLNRFRGQKIGVFVALSQNDWPYIALEEKKKSTYCFSGKTSSIASGRVSFTFGLTGPSLNVDTACSSSLVALNLAKRSIEDGESDAALVVAVNLNLHPETFVQLSRAQQLSSDGLCKAFDNGANGFARGEGCGAILLEKVAQSESPMLAILKGVSTNNDGISSSLAAPNGRAQQDCLRKGIERASVAVEDIKFIETHGAGTKLGDAIEFQSIKSIFSNRKSKLALGALKTNIGHLEAAAGMASIIKTVLVLLHRRVPQNLHLEELNDCFNVSDFPVDFMRQPSTLVEEGPLCCGISSFGMSGTNAFAILQSTSQCTEEFHRILKIKPKPISPKEYSWKYLQPAELETNVLPAVNSIPHKLSFSMSELKGMLADVGVTSFDEKKQFSELGLDSLAGIEFSQNLLTKFPFLEKEYNAANLIYSLDTPAKVLSKLQNQGKECLNPVAKPKVGLVFTGQGSQYFGMGEDLYKNNLPFKRKLDEIADIYFQVAGKDLLNLMFRGKDTMLISDTRYAQIAIFAFEIALYSCLVERDSSLNREAVLLGHSIGEYVAATLAGVFTLKEAVEVVSSRGVSMSSCDKRDGVMFAVRCDVATLKKAIEDCRTSNVSVAAINGPSSSVLSGSSAEIEVVIRAIETRTNNVLVKSQLDVSHAFHSSYMQDAIPSFTATLQNVHFKEPSLPIISELHAKKVQGGEIQSVKYWNEQLLGSVNFFGALKALIDLGVGEIIEVGPQPKLVNLMKSISKNEGVDVSIRSVIKKDSSELDSLSAFFGDSREMSSPAEIESILDDRLLENNRTHEYRSQSKLSSLYNRLFDESTLLKRMEDRLFNKLLQRWESDIGQGEDKVSLDTASIASKSNFSSYLLPQSRGLVYVFDGEKRFDKNGLLSALDDYEMFKEKLASHGSILFRNFGLKNATDFREVLGAFEEKGYKVRDYLDGISPRSEIVQGVYTSTEYAPHLNMALHNEMSYNPYPPDIISFFCVSSPRPGTGRTPLASSKAIFDALPARLKSEFKSKKLQYIVNSPSEGRGAGVSWQQMYDTDDRFQVESICRNLKIKFRWNKDGSLTTFRNASATRRNADGEVWFNHAHLFHPSDLPKSAQQVLNTIHGNNFDKYPKFCSFADGSFIKEADLEEIRRVQRENEISFDWKEGDLLVIDNYQLCHGRSAFDKNDSCRRKILASMLFN